MIAIVEDDPEISRLTELLLTTEGYGCVVIKDGASAEQAIRKTAPDLVILDIMLPGVDGLDVCQIIRRFYTGGIIMLTGVNDDISELSAFRKGADDYIRKPIRPHLLLARIEAVLSRTSNSNDLISRRTQAHHSTQCASQGLLLKIGALSINTETRVVKISDEPVSLSDAEFDLLVLLVLKQGEVMSRDECCQALRGFDYNGSDRSIDMRISTLRRKLVETEDAPKITTVRGRGYMISEP